MNNERPSNQANNDVFHINNFSIARHLLKSQSLVYKYISPANDPNLRLLIPYLTDKATWDKHKTSAIQMRDLLKKQVEESQIELNALSYEDPVRKDQLTVIISDLQGKLKLYDQNYIDIIDHLLTDKRYQEVMLIAETISQRYPDYIDLLDKLDEKKQALAIANNDAKTQIREETNKILLSLREQIKNNHELKNLLNELDYLRKKHPPIHLHHHENAEMVEAITTASESLAEVGSTSTEFNDFIHERIDQLNEMSKPTSESSDAEHGAEHLTTFGEFVRSIPIINEFIRGLNCLREAYEAYKEPHTPQRKTKIATGIFAGLVSIGTGIVGALVLAGIGLLAGAAAIVAFPIVAAALTVGVYSAILYRDGYTLHQARKAAEKAEKDLHNLDILFSREKEITISKYIDSNDISPAIKKIQDEINIARHDLHDEIITKNPNQNKIDELRHRIHDLSIERNHLIEKNPDVKQKIINELENNPRLAQLALQRSDLAHSAHNLAIARTKAKRKTFLSTLCLIGVGLLLGAVLATGIGAIVVGAIGAAVVVATSVARIRTAIKEKHEAEAHKLTQKLYEQHHIHEHIKSSELNIEKYLMHGQQHEVAKALMAERDNAAKRKVAAAAQPPAPAAPEEKKADQAAPGLVVTFNKPGK